MKPEASEQLESHVRAIAAILYQNTEPEKLETLEGIEQAVRQQMLEHVSPKIGVFLSAKRQGQQQGEADILLAASVNLASQKSKQPGCD